MTEQPHVYHETRIHKGVHESIRRIRNAKSEEKKRVYSEVLTEATKKQNEVMLAAREKQA